MEQATVEWELSKIDDLDLIHELHRRGVTITDIYGRYYEIEAASDGRTMTPEEAVLAGVDILKTNINVNDGF